ncbi:hypothetical protein BW733_08380 [Tessaracoccus flavescens]|uniref:Uncharacterized protein n=2 Tax=Tessaracoccus flavescens TaxID=399497 RepID=A0A1Q2CXQ2_9ACTN|nr:hypothetical protein BW733_08380 [Tessaracoccus flavescens]
MDIRPSHGLDSMPAIRIATTNDTAAEKNATKAPSSPAEPRPKIGDCGRSTNRAITPPTAKPMPPSSSARFSCREVRGLVGALMVQV